MEKWKNQMSESFRIGAILAFVGGFFDAYTYIARGGVFANAQTGNMILLAVHLVQREFRHSLYYLVPICAFVCGIFLDEFIKRHFISLRRLHWRQIVILIELLLVIVVAQIPLGNGNLIANVIISFVCALQVQSFRTMHGLPYATTMCTGNLRSGSEQLVRFVFDGDRTAGIKSLWYFSIILIFICGAALGAVMTVRYAAIAVLACCPLLLLTFILLFLQRR